MLAVLLFSACSKSDDSNNTIVPTESPLISKFIQLDTSVSPAAVIGTINFTYDANKRITSLYIYDTGRFYHISYYDFFYNSSDTLPYKSTAVKIINATQQVYDTSFYTYDAAARLIEQSTNGKELDPAPLYYNEVTSYVYGNGKIYVKYVEDQLYTYWKTYNVAYQNGNITTQSDYDTSGGTPVHNTVSTTYDNHPNPLYLPAFASMPIELDDPFRIRDIEKLQKNNCVTYAGVDGNAAPATTNELLTYQYRADGYPSEASIKHLSNNWHYAYANKIQFVYNP